jgi:hypothetical protein
MFDFKAHGSTSFATSSSGFSVHNHHFLFFGAAKKVLVNPVDIPYGFPNVVGYHVFRAQCMLHNGSRGDIQEFQYLMRILLPTHHARLIVDVTTTTTTIIMAIRHALTGGQ